MWDPFEKFQKTILPNNLKIHASYWPNRPWEAIGFIIHVGAKDDPIGQEGLTHFTEHVVSSNSIMDLSEFKKLLKEKGCNYNLGGTNGVRTSYSIFTPTDKNFLKMVFNFFGGMLISANFKKMIEEERQIIKREFRRDYPSQKMLEIAMDYHKILFKDFWLERMTSPIGTLASIEKISREELNAHYERFYVPANIEIMGVGGMSLTELTEIIVDSPFNSLKPGEKNLPPISLSEIAPPSENRHIFKMSDYTSIPLETTRYETTAKIPNKIHKKVISVGIEMLNEIIFQEIREKKLLSYDSSAGYTNLGAFHEINIRCYDLTNESINEFEAIIESIIIGMKNQKKLLELVKNQLIKGNTMLDLTAQRTRDLAMDDLIYGEKIISIKEENLNIKKVTMSDIINFFELLLPEMRLTRISKP